MVYLSSWKSRKEVPVPGHTFHLGEHLRLVSRSDYLQALKIICSKVSRQVIKEEPNPWRNYYANEDRAS